jgi:hypothetical protein
MEKLVLLKKSIYSNEEYISICLDKIPLFLKKGTEDSAAEVLYFLEQLEFLYKQTKKDANVINVVDAIRKAIIGFFDPEVLGVKIGNRLNSDLSYLSKNKKLLKLSEVIA